jgi:FixJ family two-component response regulator
MSHATPIVFVVDDDVSVRESLESMFAGQAGSPRHSRRHRNSCRAHESLLRAAWYSTLLFRASMVSICRSASLSIGLTCRSYGDVPMSVQAMKAGAAEFLTKPFTDDVLLSAIRRAIERRHTALRHEAEIAALQDRYASLSRRGHGVGRFRPVE